jgi:O-antigen/teichoic acid export membrane protein
MLSSGGTAVLGVVFWGIATHLASSAAIGRTSAEIAAMTLLANLAQLSFGSVFERFLPVAGELTRSFVARAYVMCVSFALVATIVYVSSGFTNRFLPSSFSWRLLFVAAVVFWTIFVLQDSVLIGLRASRWVPVENILFALAKLALLPVFLGVSASQGIFLAWSAPVALAIIGVTWYLFGTRIPEHEAMNPSSEELPSIRELVLLAGAQYTTLILSVFTTSIVTLIVIERLGAVANAYFYVPALISSGVALLLWAITRSFLVEAASEPYALRHHTNVLIGTLAAVLIPCVLVGAVFAPEFLRIFGSSYSVHGTTLLRMLLLSELLGVFSIFYTTFAWLDQRVWWTTLRQLVSVIVYFVVLLTLIGHFGILSVGIASLVSSGVQGIFFLPVSVKRYRLTSNADAP